MKIVALTEWTDALLISSTVAEPSAGEALWLAATNYALGAEVIRPNHVKYRNLIAGVDATPHETTGIAPPRWQDIGVSNLWGALDARVGTYSSGTTPMEYVLNASGCNTVAVLDMESATTVVLTLRVAAVVQWTKTVTVPELYPPTDWYQYYTAPIIRARDVVALDMPVLQGAELTVSVQAASGTVRAGSILCGYWREVGNVQWGAQTGFTDYSRATKDAEGITSIEARRRTRSNNLIFRVENEAADAFIALIAGLIGVPSLFIGSDDRTALTVYGFPKSCALVYASPAGSTVSLQLEGLNT